MDMPSEPDVSEVHNRGGAHGTLCGGKYNLGRELQKLLSLFLRGTALMLSLISCVMAVLCLGGAVNAHLDWLNHLAAIWLSLGVLAALLGAICSRAFERLVIVSAGLAAVLICLSIMMPEYGASILVRPNANLSVELKIVQFNAWESNNSPLRTVNWIIAQRADIVVLEEVGSEKKPILRRMREAYPFASCDPGGRCDTVIFSRRKQIAKGEERQEDPVASLTWATLDDPKGAFTVVGAHQSWPIPQGPQEDQMRKLIQTVSKAHRKSAIIAGDFNSTPWSFAMKRMDKDLGMHRWTRAFPSWPAGQFTRVVAAPMPILPIDHVYAGDDWQVVSVKRGPVLGSDHRPIIVTLHRTKPRLDS